MNALQLLLETTPMRALGWTLVHFVWQGVALFAVHEVVQIMLRRHSAAARYVASCSVLVAMLATAGLTMRLELQRTPVGIGSVQARTTLLDSPVQSTSDDTAREGATPPVVASKVSGPHSPSPAADCQHPGSPGDDCDVAHGGALQQEADVVHAGQAGRPAFTGGVARLQSLVVRPLDFLQARAPRLEDLLPWLVSLWLAGVFLLTTRLAIAWQEARWLRSRGVRPVQQATVDRLQEILQRLRIQRPVQVLVSALAEVPTVVGWWRPVVLLPTAAITGLPPQHLEALIAHELTHIKRHDYLVNLLQTMVETLLFYHPAVWWVSNRIRDEREHCCDDVAVQICGNAVLYARALTTMEALRSGALRPELAMAADGGSLVQRVRRLVGRGGEPATPGAGIVVGAILIAVSSLLAVSAGRSTEAEAVWQAPEEAQSLTTVETDHLGGKIAGIHKAQPAPQLPRPGAASSQVEPAAVPTPQPAFQLEEIVRMQQFGVDVDFYDEMTDLFGELQVDELVALKMYDVDRHFAEEMQPWFGELGFEELIGLKMNEVDSQYVQEMSELFGEKLAVEEIIHLRQQDIERRDIENLMQQGLDLDAHEAIALQLMGVEADALQELRELQGADASTRDMVELAKLGLDADDVGDLQHELGALTTAQTIALWTHGVDGGEIEQLREMGMHHPDAETLVHMYSMGLTADVIDTILDDEMEEVPVEALLLFKELGLEEVFLEEFRRRNPR